MKRKINTTEKIVTNQKVIVSRDLKFTPNIYHIALYIDVIKI